MISLIPLLANIEAVKKRHVFIFGSFAREGRSICIDPKIVPSAFKRNLCLDENRVFSYRADAAAPDMLYVDPPGYRDFTDAITSRVIGEPNSYVGITDIADFYPRIYQHRLVNALQAACGGALQAHIRVLEKMLSRFSENVSYGIPIGPPASRPLAEAVLIDVDSTLLSFDVDFVRFTDDYVIFGETPEDAEYGIRVLGETLFMNHGLTLQTAKTRISKARSMSSAT